MKDHPTPQPSGRMILLDTVMFDTWTLDEDGNFVPIRWGKSMLLDDSLRLLFNAICSEVVAENEPEMEGNTHLNAASVRNQLRAELRQRLKVFFNQPEESNRKGGDE